MLPWGLNLGTTAVMIYAKLEYECIHGHAAAFSLNVCMTSATTRSSIFADAFLADWMLDRI